MMALDILVCPLCKGPLERDRQRQTLNCKADRLAFPIRDGIPIMIESEALPLDTAGEPIPPAASNDSTSGPPREPGA
ncbi:MAG: Trm112 family protein [Lautropia sp.]|nr:Trm112 family protein [Lautropia sp.]